MFLLVFFFTGFYGILNYKIIETNLKTYLKNQKFNGYDERFPLKNKNITQIIEIQKFFEKKQLLDILTDNKISNNTKILLLKDINIKPFDIFAGGLMIDFDHEDF